MSSKNYRTFENELGEIWRWDGEKMEHHYNGDWRESVFTSPGDLMSCLNHIEETTLPEYDHESPERDPMDVAHEDMENQMLDGDTYIQHN